MVIASVPLIFFVVFLLAGLMFIVMDDPYINRDHRRTMMIIIALCSALMLQNYAEYILSEGAARITLRTLTSILGYSLRPLVIVMFFRIVAPSRKYTAAWALTGVNVLVYATALFSDICFRIDQDNHFHGGPLRYCCLLISGILLLYLLYLTISEYLDMPKRQIAIPILIIAMIFIAIWLDSQVGSLDQPVTYLTVGMVISCVFYYIWLHMQFVREHETDLESRQRIQIAISQIQPHFLYNTLCSIQALCHTDPEKAADITQQFSTYLRDNLNSLDYPGLISFRKDLEHARTYVRIEETRFPSIRVTWDIQDELFSVPPLTVQPIVENAIRHGVRIREEGLVEIISRRAGDAHEIIIRDNGRGFDPDSIPDDPEKHVGIRNVRHRIESMCGGTLAVESRIDEGTVVTIRIPAQTSDESGVAAS